jgi:hypothetical protein
LYQALEVARENIQLDILLTKSVLYQALEVAKEKIQLTFYSSKKGTDSTWCTNTEVQKLQG